MVSIDSAGSGLAHKFLITAQPSFFGTGKTMLRNHALSDVLVGGDASA